ncbi:hypothetical protein [Flagellimonas myxillae]|uniref:hypothetical protein n=1 Tax=Flagellimonas myxillae TaxID=2942214 RepID=UPI00201F11CA|nr:hypothetical protein [Muricauda myxillae]MCL6266499.1 hypothetical protein [Muricauda myxillae]
MKMRKLALYSLLGSWGLVLLSCGKDDSPETPTEPTYNLTEATINDDNYTAPGELSFLYSTDNGDTYTAEKPQDLSKGDELWVKINNGEVDIYEEDFYFDWSGSSISPADTEGDLAKFFIKESDISITVAVADKIELLVSHRDTGQFYVLDLSDGGLTPNFIIMKNEETALVDIRGVIYNPNDGQIYIANSEDGFGQLYSVNPKTKTPTLINNNENNTWKGLSDLIITPNNKLLAAAGFGFNNGPPALIEFELSGINSEPMEFTGDDVPCCGLGMTFGDGNQELLIGNGTSDPLKIYKSNLQGNITEVITLELEGDGFVNTEPTNYFIRNLITTKMGTIYALCYDLNDEFGDTHIAQVNLEQNKLIHIARIGTQNENIYFGLVALPAYTF